MGEYSVSALKFVITKVGEYSDWPNIYPTYFKSSLPEGLKKMKVVYRGYRLTIYQSCIPGTLLVLTTDGGTDHTNGDWHSVEVAGCQENKWYYASEALAKIWEMFGYTKNMYQMKEYAIACIWWIEHLEKKPEFGHVLVEDHNLWCYLNGAQGLRYYRIANVTDNIVDRQGNMIWTTIAEAIAMNRCAVDYETATVYLQEVM